MSYRKLEVDGKTYEYSIGKTHTKIRHVGAWKNEEVGVVRAGSYCSCGSHAGNCDFNVPMSLQVTPKDLTWFIRSGKFRLEEKNRSSGRRT